MKKLAILFSIFSCLNTIQSADKAEKNLKQTDENWYEEVDSTDYYQRNGEEAFYPALEMTEKEYQEFIKAISALSILEKECCIRILSKYKTLYSRIIRDINVYTEDIKKFTDNFAKNPKISLSSFIAKKDALEKSFFQENLHENLFLVLYNKKIIKILNDLIIYHQQQCPLDNLSSFAIAQIEFIDTLINMIIAVDNYSYCI